MQENIGIEYNHLLVHDKPSLFSVCNLDRINHSDLLLYQDVTHCFIYSLQNRWTRRLPSKNVVVYSDHSIENQHCHRGGSVGPLER